MTAAATPVAPPGEVVAHVAGRPVSRAELAAFAGRLRSGAYASVLPATGIDRRRFDRWALQLLIREALVLHSSGTWPADRPLSEVPRETLGAAVRQVKGNVTADVAIPEAVVARYYDRNVERFAVPERRRVRHVLCPDRATAHAVLRKLASDADFGLVAERRSLDAGSARSGGRLGTLRRGELPRALDSAVFAAPPQQVLGPVQTGLGWHVFEVEEILPAGRRPYEQVRDAIERELLAHARDDAFRAWLDRQSRALVTLAAGFEHPGDPSAAEPHHRH